MNPGFYPGEISWSILGEEFSCAGSGYSEEAEFTVSDCCVPDDASYTLYCADSWGDSWNGGSITINGENFCGDAFGSDITIEWDPGNDVNKL